MLMPMIASPMGKRNGMGNGLMGKISLKGALAFLDPHERIMANEIVLPMETMIDSSRKNPRISMTIPNPDSRRERSIRSQIAWEIPG
jgi:hypothetical protein